MRRRNNIKTHGTIEKCGRIDSFEAMKCDSGECDCVISAGDTMYLDCDHVVLYKGSEIKERVCLYHPLSNWSQEIRLTRIESGFGGTRAYWLCPACGERFRYLYFKGRRFICRKCAELNYTSQQETKNSRRNVRKGLKVAEKHLDWWPVRAVSPAEFLAMFPQKPRGMHWSTYAKHIKRFMHYQEQYGDDWFRESMRALRRFRGLL